MPPLDLNARHNASGFSVCFILLWSTLTLYSSSFLLEWKYLFCGTVYWKNITVFFSFLFNICMNAKTELRVFLKETLDLNF